MDDTGETAETHPVPNECASNNERCDMEDLRLAGGAAEGRFRILRNRLGPLSTARGYVTVFIGHSGSALLAVLASIFLARVLSKGDFGTYSVFLAMAIVFSSVVDMGVTSSLVRFGSRLHSEGSSAALSRITRAAIIGKLIIGVSIGVVGFLVIYALEFDDQLGKLSVLALVPICGLVLSFFFMTQGILQITRSFGSVSLLLVAKGTIFLVAVITVALADKISLEVVCSLFVIATLAVVLLFSKHYRGLLKTGSHKEKARWKDIRFLLNFGKWIAISGLSFSLFERIPIAAISSNWGPENAADFSVAITITSMLALLSMPLMTVLLPDLSRIRTSAALKKYLLTTYRFLLPLALLVLAGFVIAAEPLVTLLYGSKYSDAAPLLRILAAPFVLTFALLPISLSLTFVFNRPDIASMNNIGQLLALIAVITFIGVSGGVATLVLLYGVIRGCGSVCESIASVILLRSRRERSDIGAKLRAHESNDV